MIVNGPYPHQVTNLPGQGDALPSIRLDFTKALDSRKARKRCQQKLCQLVGLRLSHMILDVGCGAGRSFKEFDHENEIVRLDFNPMQGIFQDNFHFLHGDAASKACFRDAEFDDVVCFGVLERLTPFRQLERAALENQRAGRAYAVVVSDISSFTEPHSQRPLGQFLPGNFNRLARR